MPCTLTIVRLLLVLAFAGSLLPSHLELLERSDVGSFAPPSFRARLALDGPKGTHEVEIWRSGEDRTLIRFLDPKERGKYMVLLGRQLWLLTPGAKKPVRLRPSHRLYGGATLDEVLGMRLTDQYDVDSVAEKADGTGKLVVFDLRAKTEEVLFPSVSYVVRESTERPVSAVFSLRSGRAAASLEFLEWNEKGPLYARRVLVEDLLRKGARTEVSVVELEERQVPDALFDLEDATARRVLEARAGGD